MIYTIKIWKTKNHSPDPYLWWLKVNFHHLNPSFFPHHLLPILLFLSPSVFMRNSLLIRSARVPEHRQISRTISSTSYKTPSSILIMSLCRSHFYVFTGKNISQILVWMTLKSAKNCLTINLVKSKDSNPYPAHSFLSQCRSCRYEYINEHGLQFQVQMPPKTMKNTSVIDPIKI